MDGLKARLSFDAVAYDYDDEYLTIDTDTHIININNLSRLFGVQYDGNSKLIKFRIRNKLSDIQKMQDSIVYINWIDSKGVKGQSIAINKTINNDTCEFAWKVPFDALKNSGVLHFAMSAVVTKNSSSVIDQRWSTRIASVITPDGIYIKSYTPSSEEEDRIAQIYNELAKMINKQNDNLQAQVNSLNDDLGDFKQEVYIYDNSNINYELGNIGANDGRIYDSTKQVRTSNWVYCKRGSQISVRDGYMYSLFKYTKPSVANYVGPVVTKYTKEYIFEEDGYYKWFVSNTTPIVVDVSISTNLSTKIVSENLVEQNHIAFNKLEVFKKYNILENVLIDVKLFDDVIKNYNIAEYNKNGIVILTKLGVTKSDSIYTIKVILYSSLNNKPNKFICQVLTSLSTINDVMTFKLMHGNDIAGYIRIDISKFINLYGFTEISITDYSEVNQINEHCKFVRNNYYLTGDYFRNSTNYNEPLIVFVDDDGHNKFLNLKLLMDSRHKKCSLAVIADKVGDSEHMDIDTLLDLKSSGYDIISHTKTHDVNIYGSSIGTGAYHNFALVDDETIYSDLKGGHDFCIKYGFNADGLAFPWGHYPETFNDVLNNPDPNDSKVCGAENQVFRYTKLAQKAGFAYALNSIGGISDLESNDMFMPREEVKESKGIAYYQHMVNVTKNNGDMLIFMTHSYDESIASMNFISQIIDYIDSTGVKIVTLKEAMNVKRKSVSLGVYGDKFHSLHISADGKLKQY